MKVLLDGGLVRVSKVGRTRVYSIEPRGWEPVRELERSIHPAPAPVAPERFDALELEVRRVSRDRRDRHDVNDGRDPLSEEQTA